MPKLTELAERIDDVYCWLERVTGDTLNRVDIEEVAILETERSAWKEAFTATRAYYSNNNGENSRRYREAVARLKEMKLIK